MDWAVGPFAQSPGTSLRWSLAWGGWPGFEVFGVRPITPGSEIRYGDLGVRMNSDGSTTYFFTTTNVGPFAVQYNIVGNPIA